MKKRTIVFLMLMLIITVSSCAQSNEAKKYLNAYGDGLYGAIEVKGATIFFELYYKRVPLTVMSFVGLATGAFEGHVERNGKFFDDLTFHRVVDGFVVQGGDPLGNGTGGPGYAFVDEFDSTLRHDSNGIISMANSGPNTNGSQFFITLDATPHLDDRHSVFGKVLEGLDILETVQQDDIMQSVNIYAKGKEAKTFLDAITWDSFQALQEEKQAAQDKIAEEKKATVLAELRADDKYTETPEGLFYYLEKEGTGPAVQDGDTVMVHYDLTLFDSVSLIDSSYRRNQPIELVVGSGTTIRGWEIMLQKLKQGDIAQVVIPPELGYGDQGAGTVIPGGAFLDFKIEVVSINN